MKNTQIARSVEGNIDFDHIDNPAFFKAYYAVQNDSNAKSREISNAVAENFPLDFNNIFAPISDESTALQTALEEKAKAEGFYTTFEGEWPKHIHTTYTPIGRIISRDLGSEIVFNAMHDGASVGNVEITVELF